MARTPSNTFEKGTSAPDFTLFDTVSQQNISLQEAKGEKGTLIMFICNHCPFVLHVNEELVKLAGEYQSQGIGFIAISSNDVVNYPQDRPELMTLQAKNVGYSFPYLYDETQEIAKAYDAACTPDLYVFDQDLKTVYHGQLDDSRPGNDVPLTGSDMRAVLDSVVAGADYLGSEKPSIGCNIKWK